MLYSPLRVCMCVCVWWCGGVTRVSHSWQHGGRLHVVQPIACLFVYVYVCDCVCGCNVTCVCGCVVCVSGVSLYGDVDVYV